MVHDHVIDLVVAHEKVLVRYGVILGGVAVECVCTC